MIFTQLSAFPFATACAVALVTAASSDGDAQLVARTQYGAVRGFLLNGTRAWRGIPYAAPPTGDLRFRPPQPPMPWSGVLETQNFGASCLQIGAPNMSIKHSAWATLNVSNADEDCLFVNVYSPASGPMIPKAVMVYLHAGEFRFGSSNDLENSWPYFAGGSVVLVTSNVRLGLFGFAALDDLRSRDPSGSTGNYAMQDQRAVLRWVKHNIAHFGGDREQITIFGESSGGASVGFHLVTTASRGLFKRAILESPGLTHSHSWEASEGNTQYAISGLTAANSTACAWPNKVAAQWRTFLGVYVKNGALAQAQSAEAARELCLARPDCFLVSGMRGGNFTLIGSGQAGSVQYPSIKNNTARTGSSGGFETYLRIAARESATQCLVSASARDMITLNIAPPFDDTFATDAAAPTVDGVELIAPLPELLTTDQLPPNIDLLGGSNLDEGTEFMYEASAISCDANATEFADWAVRQFGEDLGPLVPTVYQTIEQPVPLCSPGQNTSQYWQAAMRAAGANAITCRTRELLNATRRGGGRSWWYYFVATPIYTMNMGDLRYYGAFHGAEVPFVFGDAFELRSAGERRLSAAMGCYWVNFAATGDPNYGPTGCAASSKLPQWPLMGLEGNAISFANSSIGIRPALLKEQCDVFASFYDYYDVNPRTSVHVVADPKLQRNATQDAREQLLIV